MVKSKDPLAQKILTNFNQFNGKNLEILNLFYDNSVEFQDPAVQLKNLTQLKKYYTAVYKNVKSIHFKFHEIKAQENSYFAAWTMTLSAKGLNYGKKFAVDGLSVIEFNKKGLVKFHRDYVDLGAMVYERLPLVGKLVQIVKKQLAHGM